MKWTSALAVRAGLRPPHAFALFAVVANLCAAGAAHAQPAPPPVEQHTEKVAEALKDNTTALAASLGGTLNTGNTQAWQLNVGSDFLLVRNPHSLSAMVAFAYGQAKLRDIGGETFETTVGNLRAKSRYDYFLTQLDALFASAAFRWDEFAGLDARVQGQAGYARYFLRADNHRFWGELGYDATYDDYHPLPIVEDGEVTGFTPDGDQLVHSVRAFVGYDNHLTEAVTYLGGLEGLMNVEEPKDLRINFDNALRSKLGGNFQLEVKFTLLFDNVPVPGALKLDTQTVGNIIYNFI